MSDLFRRARLNASMPRMVGTCDHCKRSGVLVRGVHPEAREDFDTDATRLCVESAACCDAWQLAEARRLRLRDEELHRPWRHGTLCQPEPEGAA